MPKLSDIIDKYNQRMIDVAAYSCDELSSRTAHRTPVDTGVLRKSWTPDLNSFDTSNSGGSVTAITSRMKIGDRYTYTNAQDYARVIEYTGHSRHQAPQGMMHITLAEFHPIVRDAIRAAS